MHAFKSSLICYQRISLMLIEDVYRSCKIRLGHKCVCVCVWGGGGGGGGGVKGSHSINSHAYVHIQIHMHTHTHMHIKPEGLSFSCVLVKTTFHLDEEHNIIVKPILSQI